MIAAELRGGDKPSLNDALRWIGSRVDDVYGAGVGRLEDVWIDPGTGEPRWLLVRDRRFGGRATLIPFEDASPGAGHVWVPYEREIVAEAPAVEPGAPLTHQVETALRNHYAAIAPEGISDRGPSPTAVPQPRRQLRREPARSDSDGQPQEAAPIPPVRLPTRPAPPVAAPSPRRGADHQEYVPAPGWQQPPQPPTSPYEAPQPGAHREPPAHERQAPAVSIEALQAIAASPDVHYVEIELSGELTIRGELRSVRVERRSGPSENR